MKILVLNGSPRPKGNTAFLVEAFRQGAEAAGHEVKILQVGKMKIAGCLGCEYCKGRGHGDCVQKDDQQQVYDAMKWADFLVLASPIYYFMLSAQVEAAIQRMHAFGIPRNIKETALILSSGSGGVYDAAVAQYHMIFQDYLGLKDLGVFTAHGMQNKSEQKENELRAFGQNV